MYPESNEMALAETLMTEAAISDFVELALKLWLPLAEAAVLQASAPPPDPTAAVEQDAQWDYLVDAIILYGLGIIAADAYAKAQAALTGVPLAVGKLAVAALKSDMPGMPSRAALKNHVSTILKRRLSINVTETEQLLGSHAPMRSFVNEHVASVKSKVLDAVARVYKRARKVTDEAPPEQAREQVVGVFDPMDPQWQAAADEVGQTHGTGTLNAALEQAARDTGREMELVWTAVLDTHTRPAHAEASGQRRAPGEAFDVDNEPLRFPGDPRGSLDNTINCRCRLFAIFTTPHPDLVAMGFYPDREAGRAFLEAGEWMVTSEDAELFKDKNWVDACGGLPKYIKRITKHLKEKGMPESQAIATAVNAAKKMCASGDVNFPGKQNVNAGSRAEACTAVAEWEKLKACAARKRATNASAARAVEWAAEMDGQPYAASTSPVSEKVDPMTDYRSFTSVLAVIGTPTDDGRMFANDIALSFRDFPLPLLWQKQSAGGHYDAFTVGVIESAGVVGNEVMGKGYLLNTPEADEAAMQIEHGVTGPSVDLGDVSWEMRDVNGQPVTEQQYYDNPDMELVQTVTSAKVLAATLVSTPAFGQTSIALGATVAKGDAALVAAAALLKPEDVVTHYPSWLFANPEFDGPTLPHITEDGRIMGHLATFNVCHIGIQDQCVIAPRSQTDYAWFHTAPPVDTELGKVKVGRLTVGGGHAGARLNVGATIAHYDNAGTCFALVHVGEDEFGIWFSGVAAPGATPEQVAAGLSAPLSGDWRNVGGNLELVAALAVNTPGFPIIASGATDYDDNPLALVASLGPCAGEPKTELARAEVDQISLARHIVAEWRAADRRDAEGKAIIAQVRREEALAIIEGAE